ncbi:hypothetical protein NQ318_022354 [Aromia moschata]|uniref:Gamma-glutamyltranspeptidase 1 n=1 Tax=Aromia moschata TaxID=1265417 RepID=A0AAV8Z6D3_9CUCU|nr:hypothetical protein NQ318_022354 [Aromia moschata]
MFCNGVVTMQSMGLGGGFLMTVYKRDEKKAYFLNAREKAPLNVKSEMYKGDPKTSQHGPLAVAVPGELRGYWTAYKRFGRLPWKELIEPTITLCENGFNMTNHQHMSLFKNKLYDDPNFQNGSRDADGKFKTRGSIIRPTRLCETLKVIAENGGDELYNDTLSKMLLEDIKAMGGIITQEDLDEYQTRTTCFQPRLQALGLLLAFILKILDGYDFTRESIDDLNSTITTYHRMIEAFKYAYAKRTELGDVNFVNISELLANLSSTEYADSIRMKIEDGFTSEDPKHYGAVFYSKEDHGTAHFSILDQAGDAVSVTSSVNIYFGAGFTSKQTGVILNSVMDDFSFPYFKNYFGLPGSPNNELKPGKRPLSSMSPTILTDRNGDVKLVVGASGGTKITTSVAQVIMRTLWFGQNIKEAVDAPRLHHQLYPMEVEYEYGNLKQVVEGLKALGHKLIRNSGSVVCALLKMADKIIGNADYRKGGEVFGI